MFAPPVPVTVMLITTDEITPSGIPQVGNNMAFTLSLSLSHAVCVWVFVCVLVCVVCE